jgi:type VI secretion system protein ImpK
MTQLTPAPSGAGVAQTASPRRGQLALTLQEAFTAVARLRRNATVGTNEEAFRDRMKQVLAAAEQEARRMGYAGGDVRYALFALIAFIDESVLISSHPMFATWARRPLQEEVFAGQAGAELFFQYLQQLLSRPDSESVADVLEVYQLCLLLGFKGRYSVTHGSELQVIAEHITQKIKRVRGHSGDLSPRWRPPALTAGRYRFMSAGTMIIGAGSLTALLFFALALTLAAGASAVRDVAERIIR